MKLRIKFAKSGCMKWIGHLDMMRYFQKAIRRAGIDIAYSEGFSPHQIMSFAAPLGVGLESQGEYLDIQVHAAGTSAQMEAQLNEAMVEGVKVFSVRMLPEGSKNAMSIVAAADYELRFYEGCPAGFADFMSREQIIIQKKTKKSEMELDIRPLIYDYQIEGDSLFLQLATGSVNNIKPELVMQAFFEASGQVWDPFCCQVIRLETYARQEDGSLIALAELGEELE